MPKAEVRALGNPVFVRNSALSSWRSFQIFSSENVLNDVVQARELHEVTGIDIEQLAIFRPKRLALHEVLVRVTADYEIPDPPEASVSSLGVTLYSAVPYI